MFFESSFAEQVDLSSVHKVKPKYRKKNPIISLQQIRSLWSSLFFKISLRFVCMYIFFSIFFWNFSYIGILNSSEEFDYCFSLPYIMKHKIKLIKTFNVHIIFYRICWTYLWNSNFIKMLKFFGKGYLPIFILIFCDFVLWWWTPNLWENNINIPTLLL